MLEFVKYVLIAGAAVLQIGGIVLLFFDRVWAYFALGGYGICVLILITLLVLERRREKKEEIDYDDCDY